MPVYLSQANARFSAFTAEDAEEARRLYVAHRLTMYARTVLPDRETHSMAEIASAGEAPLRVTGRKAGEVSVTYAAGASASYRAVSAALADLPETAFGLQLLALIRQYGRGAYIP